MLHNALRRISRLFDKVKTYEEFEKKVLASPKWYLVDNITNLKHWKKTHLRQFYNLVKGKLPKSKINELL